MSTFALHERLAADTVPVCDLALSAVRLMDERSWPWLILVPRRPGLIEITDLSSAERAQLMEEIAAAAAAIQRLHRPDKINLGALGNLVPQLHVHVLGRFHGDPAWPGPVWGAKPAREPYPPDLLAETRRAFAEALSG
jgi:diadenosine tetraphosphate (Ap4A) HIT family hydrolase